MQNANAQSESAGHQANSLTALYGLIAILVIEALAMIAVTIFLIVEALTQPALSVGSSWGLVVVVAIATAFIVALTVGTVRRQRWVRGGIVAWQALQAAVSVMVMQGDFLPWAGWLLAGLALVALILANSKPVIAQIGRV